MIASWRHVFKLDPDRPLDDRALEAVCLSGTDAIMVGGSSGVTYDNTVDLLSRVRRYEVSCVLEVSDLEAVVPGFDLYMIPIVLNAGHPDWLIGQHVRAIEKYSYMIPWEQLIPEGYIVLNPEATVAKVTAANAGLDAAQAGAYAQFADKLLGLPIVYAEYSGQLGDLELVPAMRRTLERSRLFYGGGITDAESARRAAAVCDTVVVGNAVYTDLEQALETVAAVKGTR
ncbi:heptaprenylglyceryl phosphate synthase [Paenibacillus macerans]|nr:heptaprenylglyceryl phosphate synthase [Paenibacillus macerans]MCY7561622.1 heptaprenylglyceryl phosphate synthase [Paenibacillus macerans]MEC0153344.1 heptaprenylglyceryl phosphate synthase [Paenibacillus macerans]MEC0330858.1 heptaprenylglyceryl phosphate synthase [Paenibacillus macerans]MUG23788.1 heptaprenylglyceryl phosphate synthase [Paenibacillus macerans]UMV50712.1 heptaprenylglyceryl phosphate synthase [Paenibacillus macerans]